MGHADVFLAHRAVYLSSIKLRVAKKPTDLLNRHTAVEGIGRHGPPEPVWMDVFYTGFSAKDPEHSLNAVFWTGGGMGAEATRTALDYRQCGCRGTFSSKYRPMG